MFLGEYKHQLDEKARFRIPANFKKQLGEEFVVTKGTNGCLFLFSKKGIESVFEEKLKTVSLFDAKAQKPLRLLLASAFEAKLDKQGRCLISKSLRQFANLSKDIVFIGVGNHIEIWDALNFENYLKSDEVFDNVLEGLKEYGI